MGGILSLFKSLRSRSRRRKTARNNTSSKTDQIIIGPPQVYIPERSDESFDRNHPKKDDAALPLAQPSIRGCINPSEIRGLPTGELWPTPSLQSLISHKSRMNSISEVKEIDRTKLGQSHEALHSNPVVTKASVNR